MLTQPAEQQIELLPGLVASPDQVVALGELLQFAQRRTSTMHLLTGYAGTGKTTLVQAVLQRLRSAGDRRKIIFTAPSNKAVGVLRGMTARWDLDCECKTLAQLLGLTPTIDYETGEQVFKKAYGEESKAQNYDLIVVDECSMIGAELWGYISEEANFKTQILFMGDPAQLPPVNEAISPTFTEIASQSHLRTVNRYKGAIAVIADDIRRNLSRRSEPLISTDASQDGREGTFVLTAQSWYKNLVKAFKSDAYKENPDYVRALAWTNKRVGKLNEAIRAELYGAGCDRFMVGERLVASSPWIVKKSMVKSNGDVLESEETLFHTSSEMTVTEALDGKLEDWRVWWLQCQLDNGKTVLVPVLHECEKPRFFSVQKDLAKRGKEGEKKLWNDWHENKNRFADLSYAYALTVHKSQGSTFDNVFVDSTDILRNRTVHSVVVPGGDTEQRVYERNQLLYVAFTRPSKRLFIFD